MVMSLPKSKKNRILSGGGRGPSASNLPFNLDLSPFSQKIDSPNAVCYDS